MTSPHEALPISQTHEPASAADVAAIVGSCFAANTAVYPIGGGTSLDYGLPAKKPGIGLSLTNLSSVIDYPARDMTITVGAGITMGTLAGVLADERQRLPVDVPRADRATLGAVVATNFNGPRRYGQGTIRDHVLGVSAIDGRGMAFKGGGRVVKNVAGYDFCKLLTGSLGTIGVITQLTLKLKPIPEQLAVMICSPSDLNHAEKILAALVHSRTMPAAIELIYGPGWGDSISKYELTGMPKRTGLYIAVAYEGDEPDVRWMCEQLSREWWELGANAGQTLLDADADRCLRTIIEFPAEGTSPLTLKATVVPSGVTRFLDAVLTLDANCSFVAHAGDGVIYLRMSQMPKGGVTKGLIGTLQTAAVAEQGSLVVISGAIPDATHPSVWGTQLPGLSLMNAVKREFDPKNILNPDRFVYYP